MIGIVFSWSLLVGIWSNFLLFYTIYAFFTHLGLKGSIFKLWFSSFDFILHSVLQGNMQHDFGLYFLRFLNCELLFVI